MIEVGTILQNRYRIENHIGQGGMGKVYVATDERFNSTVAIKETVFEDQNLRKAFEREARLLNSLKHSALPRVSDHFNEKDGQFLVMEYIAGDDLAEMMECTGAAFPLADVLNWANQLCDALDFLHSQNIIHRDIKPQNLKLTPGGQIVLLDFGLAKGNPTDAPHQTAAKSIFGFSRSYASLEQIQGTGTEPRSDLYSLGATLYHLLTGVPPADALTRAMNVLNGQPDPLIAANLINSKVPAAVAAILQKTMALNAGERPESAASLRLLIEKRDKRINSTASSSLAPESFADDLLSRKTQLFPEANFSTSNQSQIATAVLPLNTRDENSQPTRIGETGGESKITNLKSPANTTKANQPKRRIAVALGGLLLAGSAISAMYLYNSGVPAANSGVSDRSNQNTGTFTISAPLTVETEKPAETNLNSNFDGKYSDTKDSNETARSKSTTKNKAKETKSQTANRQAAGKSPKSNDDSDDIVVGDETIDLGNMIIGEDGFQMKGAPGKPPKPFIPFKYASPEQLRQLQQLTKKEKRVIVIKTPVPEPTQ